MMIRFGVRCSGCEESFVVRVGADSTSGTKFYFPCPHCRLPLRAEARGDDFETFVVTFEPERVPLESLPDDVAVVTANPFVPARSEADWDDPEGGFSMMTLFHLLGGDVEPYFRATGGRRAAIAEGWPKVRRLYEYYLDENWSMFDRVFGTDFGTSGLPSGATTHERATRAHHPMLAVTGSIAVPTEAMERFLTRYSMKHTAALANDEYRAFMREEGSSGRISRLQRATFDAIDLFIARSEMWALGALARHVDESRRPDLDGMVLARDEFGETRDLFQQGFEVICKSLRYLVAAQNVVKRGDPNDFGVDHPGTVPANSRPTTLANYEGLSNAYKIAYVNQVPGWEAFAAALDNKVRNTIGHASVRHDLRSGKVVSDRNPDGVTYLQFIEGVYTMFEALSVTLQVLRFARVSSSGDWGGSP